MSLNRSEKEAVINDVTSLAAKAQTLVMAEYRGITVASMDQLRISARKSGVSLSVLKNTLARRAVAGSAFEVVADKMSGPLVYGFSEDPVAAAILGWLVIRATTTMVRDGDAIRDLVDAFRARGLEARDVVVERKAPTTATAASF